MHRDGVSEARRFIFLFNDMIADLPDPGMARLLPEHDDQVLAKLTLGDNDWYVYFGCPGLVQKMEEITAKINANPDIRKDSEKLRTELQRLGKFCRKASNDESYWADPGIPATS